MGRIGGFRQNGVRPAKFARVTGIKCAARDASEDRKGSVHSR